MTRKGYNAEKNKKKRKKFFLKYFKKIIKTLVSLIGIVAILGLLYFGGAKLVYVVKNKIYSNKRFSLDEINVLGNNLVSKEEIVLKSKLELGSAMKDIDANAIEKRLKNIDRLKSVVVLKKLPDKVVIKVVEKRTYGFINISGKLFELADDATLMEFRLRKLNLPIINILGYKYENRKNDCNIAKIKNVVSVIKKIALANLQLLNKISEIIYDKEGNVDLILTNNSTRVRIGKTKIYTKARELDAMLKNENNQYSYLDFRFNNYAFARY